MMFVQIDTRVEISENELRFMYGCPFKTFYQCDRYYQTMITNFYKDYDANEKTELVMSIFERLMVMKGNLTMIYSPRVLPSFGLHICTRRPCDCYVQNCFTYCAWNWCHAQPLINSDDSWIYIPCNNDYDLDSCLSLEWPCQDYC